MDLILSIATAKINDCSYFCEPHTTHLKNDNKNMGVHNKTNNIFSSYFMLLKSSQCRHTLLHGLFGHNNYHFLCDGPNWCCVEGNYWSSNVSYSVQHVLVYTLFILFLSFLKCISLSKMYTTLHCKLAVKKCRKIIEKIQKKLLLLHFKILT